MDLRQRAVIKVELIGSESDKYILSQLEAPTVRLLAQVNHSWSKICSDLKLSSFFSPTQRTFCPLLTPQLHLFSLDCYAGVDQAV